MRIASILIPSVLLSGCVAPLMTEHPVQFTSEPPGALVTYQGRAVGVTPFVFDVRDRFGFFSEYEFVARLPDRADVTVKYTESTMLHAQGVVPGKVAFTFEAAPTAKH